MFAIGNIKSAIISPVVAGLYDIAVDVEINCGVFWNSDRIGSVKITDGVDWVAGADGCIDVVLEIVIVDVAMNGCFADGAIGAS